MVPDFAFRAFCPIGILLGSAFPKPCYTQPDGCGMMVRFMIATFSDLILRVGIAIVLSSTALGSTGIWMAWPVGWCIGTGLSLVFYFTAIRKVLAESLAKAEAEGKAAEARAEAEFAADAEMETL